MIAGVQRFREGRRIAELLDNFNYAGHRTIETSKLASLWAGEKERSIENDMVWNIKFRKIKSAVRQGFIERSETGGSTVDHLTDCDLASAAKFFRKRKWLEVKDEDDDIGASLVTNAPKPLNIRKRNNWVTRWRDESPWM